MYLNFMFLDRLLFELYTDTHTQTNTHTHTCAHVHARTHAHAHTHTHTHTHTHRERNPDEYSIVAFCKYVTTIIQNHMKT